MDRNAKERALFKDWAKGGHESKRFECDLNQDSYFIKREHNEGYMCEYGFESVPQLRDLLEEQWRENKVMDEILTAVLVAAMKNKPRNDAVECKGSAKQEVSERTEELPVYIYNF